MAIAVGMVETLGFPAVVEAADRHKQTTGGDTVPDHLVDRTANAGLVHR